jgi:hypothetical protein
MTLNSGVDLGVLDERATELLTRVGLGTAR